MIIKLDKPEAGRSAIILKDDNGNEFYGILSATQDVAWEFVNAFKLYVSEGQQVAVTFDEVDTEFTIVCSECHIYVIIDRDELSVVRIKISSKDFIKGVLAEITENLDAWASCSINSSEDTEESGRPILSHKMQLSHYTNYILHCLYKESAK